VTAATEESPAPAYRRDRLTWAAFSGLLAFGLLNAALGPALPYLRAAEHISYVASALHQVAFALGGGLAGLLAIRTEGHLGRGATIRLGLLGAAVAGLGLGYGDAVVVTVAAAFVVSLFGTSALVRMWAALADAHGERRTVAMAEGEVSVSLGGIVMPLLVAGVAATTLGWRFSFVIGGLLVAAAALAMGTVRIPPPASRRSAAGGGSRRVVLMPTLVVVLAIVALEFSLSFWLASYLNDAVGLGRGLAVILVSGLYAGNLVGRVVTSHLARRSGSERLLAAALAVGLVGVSILLAAHGAVAAILGVAVAGMGVGAMFPLASSLHVGASSRNADGAIGQVLAIAAIGQITGPLAVGAIAQGGGLRGGLLILPALILIAGAALARHSRAGA
jgi:MFS family permease